MLYATPLFPPFLIGTLVAYWFVPRPHYRKWVLTGASLALLFYLSWRSAAAFLLLSLFVYWMSRRIDAVQRSPMRTALLGAAIGLPLAYLAMFKYLPAYAPPVGQLVSSTNGSILLPLGISYFTFKFVHYVIESRRGTLPRHTLPDYLCYMSLFSIFPAGPIERFGSLCPQLQAPRFAAEDVSLGLERILFGLVKKVILADGVMLVAMQWLDGRVGEISQAPLTMQMAWLWTRFLFLYLDFSGYSDVAIGVSRLFGLRVMENFNWPLLRGNLSDFWRGWHISLSSWCRDYVYFPTFGLTRNPKFAVIVSMLVLGCWHGAEPKWILWGAWHGFGLAAWQVWQTRKRRSPLLREASGTSWVYRGASWALTVNFVVVGGVWTACDSPVDSMKLLLSVILP